MRNSILAVLPNRSFKRVGSCKPGTCTKKAALPLTLDHRLHSPELVDAPLNDLNRLFDSLADPFGDGRLRDGEPDQSIAGVADFKAALAAGAERPADRLRRLAQLCQRGRHVGVLADAHFRGVVAHGQAGIADLGVPQRTA